MIHMPAQFHTELLERCRKGERDAQFEVYKLYSKAMLNTAHRITGDLAEAEDVLQESFLHAFMKIDSWQGTATFGAWLKRIVVNKSINALNRRRRRPTEEGEAEAIADIAGEPGDAFADIRFSIEEVRSALQQLPDGYRVVFSLYLLEGYDHEEIAGILGISVSGSKSQLNRAKNKLKEMLGGKQYV